MLPQNDLFSHNAYIMYTSAMYIYQGEKVVPKIMLLIPYIEFVRALNTHRLLYTTQYRRLQTPNRLLYFQLQFGF